MFTPRKQLSVALGSLALVSATVGIGLAYGPASGPVRTAQAANAPAPAMEINVATVVSQAITNWQSYSGRLEAIDRVDVRPLVPGTIVAVHFQDGAIVKKGDPLFTIDPRPYQAEVDRVTAQLAAARARATYTSDDATRAIRLLADNAIAKRDYDEKQNAAREAVAGVKAAEAALETAQINLGYTRVLAPVAGRVSRAELTVGNVVSAGASAPVLTTLVSVSPIYASFDVDEQTYLQYLGRDRNEPAPVEIGLANEAGYSRHGIITSVDNRLDTSSGTIRVRATIENADAALVPGLYARVKVGDSQAHPAILIDDVAVGTDQDKKYVLVVDGDNKVEYRAVQLGALHGKLREVTAGLKAGERVIVNGMMHVRPSDIVRPHMVDMTDIAKSAA